MRFGRNTFHNGGSDECDQSATADDTEYALTMRKRVIQFVQKWVIAVRQAVFEESLTVAFIEVRKHKFKYTFNGICKLIDYNGICFCCILQWCMCVTLSNTERPPENSAIY